MSTAIVACLLCALAVTEAQSPQAQSGQSSSARDNAPSRPGTAIIRGRIVDAQTAAPLRRADVSLTRALQGTGPQAASEPLPAVATDEEGRFEFRMIPAGRYLLIASKSGYMQIGYGMRRPLEVARPIDVANGQLLERMDIGLPRGAAIVARITDMFGEPIAGLTVRALQLRFSGGMQRLTDEARDDRVTDDLGEMRLYDLAPGDYYVSAAGSPFAGGNATIPLDRDHLFAPTYYPGTASSAEAQKITLGVGQEVKVTFPLTSVRVARVSGVIRGSNGKPLLQPGVTLTERQEPGGATNFGAGPRVVIDAEGRFTATNVMPGKYVLMVRPQRGLASNISDEVAVVPLTLSGSDITGLTITTGKGATIRGRFVFDTGTPSNLRPGAQGFSVAWLPPVVGVIGGAPTLNPDWTFELTGVVGTGGIMRLGPPFAAGWSLKAVIIDGKDVADTTMEFGDRDINGVDVVLTQTRSQISGTVTDDQNTLVRDYVAVIFSEDSAHWNALTRRVLSGRPDQQSRFTILGLPPGRYFAAAVEYLAVGEERDPSLLAKLKQRATPFTIGEGESRTVNLKLIAN